MRIHIRHETFYAYETPLSYSVQRLYLTPQNFAAQKIVDWKITAPGIEGALTYLDGFGNRIHLVTIQNIEGPMSIVAEGLVDVEDAAGVVKGLALPGPGRHIPAPDRGNAAQPRNSGHARKGRREGPRQAGPAAWPHDGNPETRSLTGSG